MRRAVLLSLFLLACGEDGSQPTQPIVGAAAEPEISADAATVRTDPAPGLTRGFFASGIPGGAAINIGTDFTVIQRMMLPVGKYLVNSSAVLASGDPEARMVDCILTVNGARQGELARGMVGGLGPNNFTSLPNTAGFTTSVRSELAVACRADLARRVVSQESPLTAIQVDVLRLTRN
jgi:hypothetical protein